MDDRVSNPPSDANQPVPAWRIVAGRFALTGPRLGRHHRMTGHPLLLLAFAPRTEALVFTATHPLPQLFFSVLHSRYSVQVRRPHHPLPQLFFSFVHSSRYSVPGSTWKQSNHLPTNRWEVASCFHTPTSALLDLSSRSNVESIILKCFYRP